MPARVNMQELPREALVLNWVFGMNKDILGGVHNLSTLKRKAIFFAAGHTGVIHEFGTKQRTPATQTLLRGHESVITCTCVSSDRCWVCTADVGANSMLVVWDSATGAAVRTIVRPHLRGVVAMDLSADALYLATMGYVEPGSSERQDLRIWQWTNGQQEGPYLTVTVPTADLQTCVRFNTLNEHELISNGEKRVFFWTWEEGAPKVKFYAPAISSKDFRHPVGRFTQSLFIPRSTQAISSTAEGDLILWDNAFMPEDGGRPTDKRPTKAIRLSDVPILYMTQTDKYIVFGSEDGSVKFYDFSFRIVAWFEDLCAGPVKSISFSHSSTFDPFDMAEFNTPHFIVATSQGSIIKVNPSLWDHHDKQKRSGKHLLQLQDSITHALAAHPSRSVFAVGGYSGQLQLWEYNSKELLAALRFDKLMPHCLAFDKKARFLAVGFTNGTLKILHANDLSEVPKATFKNSKDCVTSLLFSSTENPLYLVHADADKCVTVYKHTTQEGVEDSWTFVGKYRTHSAPITGISFCSEQDAPAPSSSESDNGSGSSGNGSDGSSNVASVLRLLSLGEDRRLVEYEIVPTELRVKSVVEVEQTATPTALSCYAHAGREELVVVADSHFKLKLLNASTKMCRRTVLGPTFAGPLNRILNVPTDQAAKERYVVYGTHNKVIGLLKTPLDGNPFKAMGLIAHAGEVSNMCMSYDGRYVLTCGGSDACVNLWALHTSVLDDTAAKGGIGLNPFLSLLEGGRDGELWNDIKNYFYYAQVLHGSEDSTDSHALTPLVPISQVANIVRAVGYYPTEREIEELENELKFCEFVDTGKQREAIPFADLIKVYLNHRPVFAVTKRLLSDAFLTLGADPNSGALDTNKLLHALEYDGEQMTNSELLGCMHDLLGDEASLPANMDHRLFAHQILQFEDYEPPSKPPTPATPQTPTSAPATASSEPSTKRHDRPASTSSVASSTSSSAQQPARRKSVNPFNTNTTVRRSLGKAPKTFKQTGVAPSNQKLAAK
eukprot:TRINITY_DN251_c0_g1_i11.p1 TRINITY_DN251_c0_g1~~TRINITY_DN251_c0_g1_i11.p1  ORF type:complete len:1005 (+),score=248.37 TRINITY_DN251_c0_g1_i11:979-3993(+)